MSNKALNWAWAAKIPAGPKFVLVALADHATDHDGEDWSCFPSNERLMDFTGFTQRTLERHLEWLDLMGWVSRIAGRDRRGRLTDRRYRLHRVVQAKPGSAKLSKRPAESAASDDDPPANMAGGETGLPPANSGPDQPPDSGPPPARLAGGHNIAEPPKNPQEPPQSAGARELARWLWGLWPEDGRKGVSSPRQVEAALADELPRPDWSEAAFRQGARAYVANRKVWGSSGRPMAAHNWVAAARWQGLIEAAPAGEVAGFAEPGGWPGPSEIRADLVARFGEAWCGSWLDRGGWDGEAIVARTRIAAATLRQALVGTEVQVKDPTGARG
jgi:hypothetical protein